MAGSTFVRSTTQVFKFSQHLTSPAAFQTVVNADFPELGGAIEILKTTADPTTAILVVPGGPTLKIPLNSWLGCNNGIWEVYPNSAMGGTVFHPYTP